MAFFPRLLYIIENKLITFRAYLLDLYFDQPVKDYISRLLPAPLCILSETYRWCTYNKPKNHDQNTNDYNFEKSLHVNLNNS